ncbi:MAG: DivIVA domain-containing protein [Acidimicrobiales bacterium]
MTTNAPKAALDSLRSVEFRQTLRGYHIDDVDEYLERVAVEADALQEQFRQMADRLRQAGERIAQLEGQRQPSTERPSSGGAEETLQRTLLLAQKFVDQTQADAEASARATLEEAQQRARALVSDAEAEAKDVVEHAQGRLRDEVSRLEALRDKLVADVETVSHYLDAERARLRVLFGDMVHWVDEHLQPTADVTGGAQSAPAHSAPVQATGRPQSIDDTGSLDIDIDLDGDPAGDAARQGLLTLGQATHAPSNGFSR